MPELHPKLFVYKLERRKTFTGVSAMPSQETELRTQLLTVHQEKIRLNDLVNQIKFKRIYGHCKTWISAAITDVEIRTQLRAVWHLRSSMGRNLSTGTRDAEDLQKMKVLNRDNLRHFAEVEAAELETVRLQFREKTREMR